MKWGYRMLAKDMGCSPFRAARVLLLLLLSALALAPAACGRKGQPVLPPGQSDNYPHRYPQSTEPQQGVFN